LELSQLERPVRLFIDDRDSKFVDDRDQVLSGEAAKGRLTPYRRPRAHAHCERVIRTIRHEALDWLIVFDERHLRRVLREYVAHYNRQRPHPALDLRPPKASAVQTSGPVCRRQRLIGLINEYERAARSSEARKEL
jgi:putative transposase